MSGWDPEILAKFGVGDGKWQCPQCLTYNAKSLPQCAACEASNPETPSTQATSTNENATKSNGSANNGLFSNFTFGQPSQAQANNSAAPASGGVFSNFTFGQPQQPNEKPSEAQQGGIFSGFTFGAPSESVNTLQSKGKQVEPSNYFESIKSEDFANDSEASPENWITNQSVALQERHGSIYTLGTGDCEQLGHADEEYTLERPRRIESLVKQKKFFIRVVVGGMHNLALNNAGEVWSWGCNDDCALGREGEENRPLKVEGLDNVHIIDISAGDCHSAALDNEGNVWTWGTYKGGDGYMGHSAQVKKQTKPCKIEALRRYGKAVAISSGTDHTAALLDNGKVAAWGYGEQGQLGKQVISVRLRGNRHHGSALTPKLLPLYNPDVVARPAQDAIADEDVPKSTKRLSRRAKAAQEKAVRVCCGGYSTYIVGASGRLYVCGLNNYGQLGTGDNENITEPTELSSLRGVGGGAFHVVAGSHHALVLCRDGSVYALGRGDSGQLGVSKSRSERPPAAAATYVPLRIPQQYFQNSRVVQVAAAGCFSLALTAKGDVYSWGYGDMSQLGNAEATDEYIPFNMSSAGDELKNKQILQIGAGGQHTVLLCEDDDARKAPTNVANGVNKATTKRKANSASGAERAAKRRR